MDGTDEWDIWKCLFQLHSISYALFFDLSSEKFSLCVYVYICLYTLGFLTELKLYFTSPFPFVPSPRNPLPQTKDAALCREPVGSVLYSIRSRASGSTTTTTTTRSSDYQVFGFFFGHF